MKNRKGGYFRKYRRSKLTRLRSTAIYKQYLKDRNELRCHVCGWFDPTIQPFYMIEIHHIKRVADGGKNEFTNYLALCPNHHNLSDRISKKHSDLNLTREVLISLIHEHEFNRQRFK